MRTVFTSQTSFQEAQFKARLAGFTPVGQARNPRGQFVVFAERKDVSQNRRVWW